MSTRNEYGKEVLPGLGTDWKLAFGGGVGKIENILACVQTELQVSYTRNTYNNVL